MMHKGINKYERSNNLWHKFEYIGDCVENAYITRGQSEQAGEEARCGQHHKHRGHRLAVVTGHGWRWGAEPGERQYFSKQPIADQ